MASTRGDLNEDHQAALREKDEEIEVYKSGMEQALMKLEELKLVSTSLVNNRRFQSNKFRTKETRIMLSMTGRGTSWRSAVSQMLS